MEEFLTVPKLMEIGFNTLSAAVGLFVVAVARRVAPAFTLSAHRRAMRVLAAAAVVVIVSEVMGVAAALTRPSTLTDVAEEFAELVAVAAAAAVLRYLHRAEMEEISRLRRSANVDGLTGLASRSFFERAARRRVERAMENGTSLSCVLLVNGDAEGALEVAERIREAVQRECVPATENPLEHPITVSLGVVSLSEETKSLERLIAMADAEMYRSKKTGKNRVSVFQSA